MSGSMYYDCPSCGELFHESEMPEHWQHVADRVEELETALEHIAAEGCPMPPFFDRAANREPCGKCANCIARQALSTQPHQDKTP